MCIRICGNIIFIRMCELVLYLFKVCQLYQEQGSDVVARYQYHLVESTDPNGNSPLSEAGAGGDSDTIQLALVFYLLTKVHLHSLFAARSKMM